MVAEHLQSCEELMGAIKLTKANVTEALQRHSGILLHAATALGVSRQSVYNFIQKHPELEEVRREAVEGLIDIAEGHLKVSLTDGDMKSIRWYLERQGKNRGYTTRVEQTGAEGGPLEYEKIERTIIDPEPHSEDVPDSE